MIHTLAPPKVRELIGEVSVSPVQPWDALICTSPAVRQCLEGLLDRWQEHLSQRFGAIRVPRPQLPLLPLGVDQAALLDQRADKRSRDFLRSYLGLAEHDVLVLWLDGFLLKRRTPRACSSLFRRRRNVVDGVSIS